MSAETVIILVGAAMILFAVLDSISSLNLMDAKVKVPLGGIGIILMIYGGATIGTVSMPGQLEEVVKGNQLEVDFPVTRVQTISPLKGDTVDCRILTMGVYPESHEKDLWILLKPSDGKYYPQSDHTNTSFKRNGEWQVITRFGGDQGEAYDIIVYETDKTASAFFSETIEAWKEALEYPGLESEDLPPGATEVDRLVVTLRENCRGVF